MASTLGKPCCWEARHNMNLQAYFKRLPCHYTGCRGRGKQPPQPAVAPASQTSALALKPVLKVLSGGVGAGGSKETPLLVSTPYFRQAAADHCRAKHQPRSGLELLELCQEDLIQNVRSHGKGLTWLDKAGKGQWREA